MQTPHPPALRWIALGLLIWNLIGVAMFVSQWRMDAQDIAQMPSTQQFLWTHMSARVWIAYATAVIAGTLGAAALWRRHKVAVPLFAVSLLALVIQFTNPVLLKTAAREGYGLMAFPLFLIGVGGAQLLLAYRWRSKGWLA